MIQPAGFWIRFGAYLIDSILFMVVGFFLSIIFSDSTSSNLNDVSMTAYSIFLPMLWYGYTVGKRAVGIRIVRTNGTNVGFWTMIKRNILSALAYTLPLLLAFLIGFILLGFDGAKSLLFSDDALLMEADDGTWLINGQDHQMIQAEKADTIFLALLIGLIGTLILVVTSGLMVVFRKDKRSLHDWIAGTYVTHARPDELPLDEEPTEESGQTDVKMK